MDCLCLAAKWTEVEGELQDWISRCNNLCTVAVFKKQMILENFQKQLSCGGASDGEGEEKVENVSDGGSALQTPVTPPALKPANEVAPALAPPAAE